ncbi:MAG: ComEC family competence protein [Chlorobi bacterium]|nr:ComEC family competence protein [Chlorobiota bacterium]
MFEIFLKNHYLNAVQFNFIQFLKQLPFSRLIFPLIAGILFALNLPIDLKLYVILFISVLVILFFSVNYIYQVKNFKNRRIPGLLITIILILGGAILLKENEAEKINNYEKVITGEAVISEPLTEKENSYKSILQSVTYRTDDTVISENSNLIVYFAKDSSIKKLKYGDKIIFKGRISEIKNPGNPHEFNYKRYLHRKGINGQIFLKNGDWKCTAHHRANLIFDFAYSLRNKLETIYEKFGISGNELSVLQALTLGDRSEINDEIRQSYIASGAMHILAVSGLHVGIIYWLFNFLLGFLDKFKIKDKNAGKQIKAVILILIIWSFAILSGLSPSIRRAAVMFSFIIIGRAINRHVNIYNSVSASAFILLIINPYQITEVGFQLSYTAVLGIIFFQPKIVALFNIKNKILYYLWSLTAVSIAAQITTFPIALYYFHIFPTLFFLSNIIVIPAATLILIAAFFLLISSSLPYIPDFIALILKFVLKILNTSVSFIEKIPYSTIQNISFHTEDLIFAFLFIISSTVFILLKKTRALQISLSILIIWISFGTFQKINISRHNQFIIYNIKNQTAVDITGTQNYFLSDKSIFKTKSIIYGIQPNRQFLNKTSFKFIPVDTAEYKSDIFIKKGALTVVGNKTFLLLNKKFYKIPDVNKKFKIDYVILSGNTNISIRKIEENIDFKMLILDSSNDFYTLKRRKEECEKLKQNYYSVTENGAFSTDI